MWTKLVLSPEVNRKHMQQILLQTEEYRLESTKKSQLIYITADSETAYFAAYLQNNQKKEFWLVSKAEQPEAAVPVQSDVVPAPTLPRRQLECECDLTPNSYGSE